MSFNAARRTIKRAAATMAERKIKVTLDEISSWSGSEGSSESTTQHRLSDFDDLPMNKRQRTSMKATTSEGEHIEIPAKRKAPSNEEPFEKHSNKPDPSAFANEVINSESTATELSSGSPSDASSSDPAVVKYMDYKKKRKERRAQARQQHSNQPMILSRRLSYRLVDPDLSPMFSPIAAMKLLFPPTLKKQELAKAKARLSP